MKLMLSINSKFFNMSPLDLMNLIKDSDSENIISGIEFCLSNLEKEMIDYAYQLNLLCQNNHYSFQIHGNSKLNIEMQKEMLDFINTLSDDKINVVLHPLSGETLESEIQNSNEYFSQILNYIYEKKYHITISMENLNSTNNNLRLNKELILPILSNNEDLYFTYDIGHEMVEYGNITDLNPTMIHKLNNIHIHTFQNEKDHLPIAFNTENKLKWVKALEYLKYLKYDGPLVLEYDIYQVSGLSLEEKILNYVKEVEYLSDYI